MHTSDNLLYITESLTLYVLKSNFNLFLPSKVRSSNRLLSSLSKLKFVHIYDRPTRPDQIRPDQIRPDQIRPSQIRPDQIRPDQTRPDQTRPDQTRPDQTRPDQTRPDQTRPDQIRPDQIRPDKTVIDLPTKNVTTGGVHCPL
jgi:hypothetical protein